MTAETASGARSTGGSTTGQRVLRGTYAAIVLIPATDILVKLCVPGDGLKITLGLAPAAVVTVLAYIYLVWYPEITAIRWALKHRDGTPEEYRLHRTARDAAALARARTGIGRWVVGLRDGTWK